LNAVEATATLSGLGQTKMAALARHL
jgi:hypothetical protein